MEILIAVAAKVAEYTVDLIKSGASSIFYPQAIIKETCKEFNQLQDLRNKVNVRCEEAIENGEEIVKDVDQWLRDSQATLDEVVQWLGGSRNWLWALKQRKNAVRKKRNLHKLLKQGQEISCVSRSPAAKGILLLSGDGYIVFDSVKLAHNEINKALNDKEQSMIGVYGMGGIGKTSLVKKVLTEAKDMQLFNRVVVSVISRTVDIRKIQAELGEQLSLKYSKDEVFGRATQLEERMKYEKGILVVLDDVWTTLDLKMVGIPFGDDHKGCKILLTTRQEDVCKKMNCKYPIKLKTLNDEDSWDLFKRYADPMLCDPQPLLQKVAEEVTQECDGLPLALIAVASALRDKSQDEWELALKRLQNSRLKDIDERVYECIKLSYDFLKLEVTKRLFLMCSLFPEDCEISVGVLTRYALGYGLIDQDIAIDSYKLAKMEVGIGIRNLLSHNLLLKPDNMSDCIKMHDVVRDAALSITSEGKEVFLVPIHSYIHWSDWKRDTKVNDAKVISLLACPENQYLPSPTTKPPRLEMLLLAQRKPLQNVTDNCFEMMITLRVLDMTTIATDPLELVLPSSLQNLSNLRTLYLRRWILKGNMSIIGKLRRLEILSFAGSVLDKLPQELLDLSELKFFDLSACKVFDSEVLGKLMLKVEKFYPPNNPCTVRHDSG